MLDLWQDLKYALRTFLQKPAAIGVIILMLALGIGANTAIFSLIDGVLFRPLPVRNPEDLVRFFATSLESKFATTSSSYPVYTDYRDQSKSFSSIAAYSDWNDFHISMDGRKAERVKGAVVTGNYFQLAGVPAILGRTLFTSDDLTPGAHPVAVLSHRFWKRMYSESPGALNSKIRINGSIFTIVGVLPAGFLGLSLNADPQIWIPMAMAHVANPQFSLEDQLFDRRFGWLDMIGRLKPGVTLEQAQAELQAIAVRRAESQPAGYKDPSVLLKTARKAALNDGDDGLAIKISWILMGVVLMVLLIACAVAAGLLLVRAEQRQREIGIRLAIGASRFRLIRQFLIESILLSAIASVGGILLAQWILDFLLQNPLEDFAIPLQAATPILNWRVFLFTSGIATFAGMLFGLAPALHASRLQFVSALKSEIVRVPGSRQWAFRNLLIPVQISISVILLIGAGLLLRTLWKASSIDPGFQTEHAFVATLDLARQGYKEANGQLFYNDLLARVRNIPGVREAGLARTIPVQDGGMIVSADIPGYTPPPGRFNYLDLNIVSPEYFAALGIPVLGGRNFDERDKATSRPVAIINEEMARHFWKGKNPVGKIMKNIGIQKSDVEIIGIVKDVHYRNLKEPSEAMIYMPLSQFYMPSMSLLIRTEGPEATVAPALFSAVESLNRDLPLFQVTTLREKVGHSLTQERLVAFLLSAFGFLALFLAVVGLYSLISYSTEIRTRELGIRIAMGAAKRDLFGLVLRQGMMLALSGLAIGVVLSVPIAKLLSGLLFGVSGTDPATFISIAILLTLTAVLACTIPGRRAARLNPMEALRYE